MFINPLTKYTLIEVLIHIDQKCSFFSIPAGVLILGVLIHGTGMTGTVGLMSHTL